MALKNNWSRQPVEENVYKMSEEQRQATRYKNLPQQSEEAIVLTEKSELLESTGRSLFNAFIKNKKVEYNQYRIQVTEYEIKKYLPIL